MIHEGAGAHIISHTTPPNTVRICCHRCKVRALTSQTVFYLKRSSDAKRTVRMWLWGAVFYCYLLWAPPISDTMAGPCHHKVWQRIWILHRGVRRGVVVLKVVWKRARQFLPILLHTMKTIVSSTEMKRPSRITTTYSLRNPYLSATIFECQRNTEWQNGSGTASTST